MKLPTSYSIKTPPNINANELTEMINKNYHGQRYNNLYWGCTGTNKRGFEEYTEAYWADPNDGECSWFVVSRRKRQKHSFKITPRYTGFDRVKKENRIDIE